MAKFQQRVQDNHVELGTVVPLAQPYVLLVDPSNICNLKCKFCPSGDLELIKSTGRNQCFLDFDLFKKIIDDLSEYEEPVRVLRLYKEGEPLLNPKFADMIDYAKKSGRVKRVDTTSNGLCLNKELNRKIIEAGLDQINISVNGVTSEQISHYCHTKIDFDEYVSNIKDLFEHKGNCTIYIKSIKENLTDEEQKKFLDIFGPIADRVFLEHISPAWPEFSFNKDVSMDFTTENYGQQIIDRKVCPYIFYIQVINSDGSSSFCVGDWPHCKIAGDVKKQSLKSIWLGKVLNHTRLEQLKGNRSKQLFCGQCEVCKYGTLDNLDPYIPEILKRMEMLK